AQDACKAAHEACTKAHEICSAAAQKFYDPEDLQGQCRYESGRCQALSELCKQRPAGGCWIDAATGEPAPNPATGLVNPFDPKHAHDPSTGKNLVRVPCPPPNTGRAVVPPNEP